MKKIKFSIKLIIVGLFYIPIFGLFSCSKEDESNAKEIKSSEIVRFNNMEEYQKTLDNVLSMDLNELRKYEEEKGYASLGRTCEEFYRNIDVDDFYSIEEIKTFAEINSDYVQLIEKDGELYFESVLYNSPNRYFIGDDRIFQIGDELYKEYPDGTIKANKKYKEVLLNLEEKSIYTIPVDTNVYSIIERHMKTEDIGSEAKDGTYNCGVGAESTSTNGNNRTSLDMALSVNYFTDNGMPKTMWTNNIAIRVYKRTLGVWFSCSRTISCDIKVAIDAGDSRVFIYENEPGIGNSQLYYPKSETVFGTLSVHYGGYDCWADTPSTPPASFQCNTNLF